MTSTTFANGETLTSTALTLAQMNAAIQSVCCDALGIPTGDPARDYAVRDSWQTKGSPAWKITDDVLFIRCVEEPNDYSLVRNMDGNTIVDGDLVSNEEYTRVWRVFLVFYGPNSLDRARLVKSAMLLDWTHDTLASSGLYIHPDIEAARRVPELENGQWWERVDLSLMFNEDVRETLTVVSVQSVKLNLTPDAGPALTPIIHGPVTGSDYGSGEYNAGEYGG